MKLVMLMLSLSLVGCASWSDYSCGGKIHCNDPDTALSKWSDRVTGVEEQRRRNREQQQQDLLARQAEALRTQNLKNCDLVSNTESAVAKDIENNIKESILIQLKDPESARFSMIRGASEQDKCRVRYTDIWAMRSAADQIKDWKYIGLVNSKNSYGGYVGFTMFISNGSISLIVK